MSVNKHHIRFAVVICKAERIIRRIFSVDIISRRIGIGTIQHTRSLTDTGDLDSVGDRFIERIRIIISDRFRRSAAEFCLGKIAVKIGKIIAAVSKIFAEQSSRPQTAAGKNTLRGISPTAAIPVFGKKICVIISIISGRFPDLIERIAAVC